MSKLPHCRWVTPSYSVHIQSCSYLHQAHWIEGTNHQSASSKQEHEVAHTMSHVWAYSNKSPQKPQKKVAETACEKNSQKTFRAIQMFFFGGFLEDFFWVGPYIVRPQPSCCVKNRAKNFSGSSGMAKWSLYQTMSVQFLM